MSAFPIGLSERLAPSVERAFRVIDAVFERMRVGLPGIVQSFDAGPPATVNVQVATMELAQWNQAGGAGSSAQFVTRATSLPLLTRVPVAIYSAGGWSFTLPITAGDECLVLFADTDPQSWFQAGGTDNVPISTERHCLSNAIAVFGLRSKPRALSNYSTGSAQVRSDDGSVVIDLAADQITLTAPTVKVNASDTATIQADTINIEGSSAVNITGGGNTKIEQKTFLTHEHTLSPSGETGPVV